MQALAASYVQRAQLRTGDVLRVQKDAATIDAAQGVRCWSGVEPASYYAHCAQLSTGDVLTDAAATNTA
jgi:hypothetical protein